MQAIIFAAGKGTRFGDITKEIPKPLIPIKGKPVIERIIENLPSEISEVILVVNYLSDKIKNYLGEKYNGLPIKYIEQKDKPGTAGALWTSKDLINDRFMILNGDDFIKKSDFPENIENNKNWLFGVHKVDHLSDNFLNVVFNKNKIVERLERPTKEFSGPFYISTGVCVIDKRIFSYEPFKLKNGEYGALHTIIQASKEIPLEVFEMKGWLPMNHKDHLQKIEEKLS